MSVTSRSRNAHHEPPRPQAHHVDAKAAADALRLLGVAHRHEQIQRPGQRVGEPFVQGLLLGDGAGGLHLGHHLRYLLRPLEHHDVRVEDLLVHRHAHRALRLVDEGLEVGMALVGEAETLAGDLLHRSQPEPLSRLVWRHGRGCSLRHNCSRSRIAARASGVQIAITQPGGFEYSIIPARDASQRLVSFAR